MTSNDAPSAALAAVLAEADAKICGNCGKRAAVRTPGSAGAEEFDVQADVRAALAPAVVWFCFECGHESADVQ